MSDISEDINVKNRNLQPKGKNTSESRAFMINGEKLWMKNDHNALAVSTTITGSLIFLITCNLTLFSSLLPFPYICCFVFSFPFLRVFLCLLPLGYLPCFALFCPWIFPSCFILSVSLLILFFPPTRSLSPRFFLLVFFLHHFIFIISVNPSLNILCIIFFSFFSYFASLLNSSYISGSDTSSSLSHCPQSTYR